MPHFKEDGLSFPIPLFMLEVLAELGMTFTQMCPYFLRYYLTLWIVLWKRVLNSA